MLKGIPLPPEAVHAAFVPLSDGRRVGEALAQAGIAHAEGGTQCVSLQFKAYRRAESWSRAGARVCYRVRTRPQPNSGRHAEETILHGWARWSSVTDPLPMGTPGLRAPLGDLTLELWPVPDDESLPGLRPLWTLPHGDAATAPRLMSYRPGVRALLRYAPHDDTPETWAKTFPSREQAQLVHARTRRIQASCDGSLHTPPLLALDAPHAAVWHLGAMGTPLTTTLGATFEPALTQGLAQALARLHTVRHQDLPRLQPDAQIADAVKKIARLRDVRPELTAEFEALHVAIEAGRNRPAGRPDVALHGDFHLRQWLRAGDRLTLCDFDEVCLGEPEVDVASLLMDLALYGLPPATVDAWTRHFVHAYARHASWGLDRGALCWHLHAQATNKMHRAWVQLHPDLTGQCRHYLAHLDNLLPAVQP